MAREFLTALIVWGICALGYAALFMGAVGGGAAEWVLSARGGQLKNFIPS